MFHCGEPNKVTRFSCLGCAGTRTARDELLRNLQPPADADMPVSRSGPTTTQAGLGSASTTSPVWRRASTSRTTSTSSASGEARRTGQEKAATAHFLLTDLRLVATSLAQLGSSSSGGVLGSPRDASGKSPILGTNFESCLSRSFSTCSSKARTTSARGSYASVEWIKPTLHQSGHSARKPRSPSRVQKRSLQLLLRLRRPAQQGSGTREQLVLEDVVAASCLFAAATSTFGGGGGTHMQEITSRTLGFFFTSVRSQHCLSFSNLPVRSWMTTGLKAIKHTCAQRSYFYVLAS